jgi:hypothetical protein
MGGCGCKKKNTQTTTQTTTQQTQDQVVNVAVQLREMIEKKEL